MSRTLPLCCSIALASVVAASACDTERERDVAIRFGAVVGDEPFACGRTYEGIGLTGTSIEALEFRMYVHDVALVTADGERVPVELEQDGSWQRETLALLDFEDGSGSCGTGNAELRTEVRGTVPEGDYVAVEFAIGVPEALNHLDAATAPPPLNVPGLWWSWAGGYKYVRLDVKTPDNPSFYFHLGATACEGSPAQGFSCSAGNVPTIVVNDFDPDRDVIEFDLAELYAGSDLDAIPSEADAVSGCMAFGGDPECPPIFERLGMPFESQGSPGEQVVFRSREVGR